MPLWSILLLAGQKGQKMRFFLKQSLYYLLIGIVLLAACSQAEPETTFEESSPSLTLAPCDLQGIDAECGELAVYENRADTSGRTIEINVAVVRAKEEPVQPDPIFFFTGGPGGAGTQLAQFAAGMFAEVNQQRDIVLFDQRGTGESNMLVCPKIEEDEKLEDYAGRCLVQLTGDPRFYTTAIAMQDVEEIRQALGYETINLYGVSYGATAVQVYMNMYPDRVRSAVLDHGTLLQISFSDVMPRNSQIILDRVFALCQADTACNRTYPNLRDEFAALLIMLKEPVLTGQFDPITSQRVTMTRSTFNFTIHYLLKSAERIALLPSLIHSAYQGNWERLALQYTHVLVAGDGQSRMVMPQVIWCYEDWAAGSLDQMAVLGKDSYYLENGLETQKSVEENCRFVPDPGQSAHHGPALSSNIPVLLFTGDVDPQNPPENVAGYQNIWHNSLDVIQPGMSHEYPFDSCVNTIMAAFVETASVKDLPLACVTNYHPPVFK